MNCSPSMNDYSLAPKTDEGHANLVLESTVGRSDANDGSVDNPLAALEEDPSLSAGVCSNKAVRFVDSFQSERSG
ncbi:hypothetical protein LINPERPRIM_LOCUS43724 [Linum perenne]